MLKVCKDSNVTICVVREDRVDTSSSLQPYNPLLLHWAHHLPNPHLSGGWKFPFMTLPYSLATKIAFHPWQHETMRKMDHVQAKVGVQTNVRTLKREMISLWEIPVSAGSNQVVTDICAHHLLKTFHQKPICLPHRARAASRTPGRLLWSSGLQG